MELKPAIEFIEICRTCLQKISDASQLFYMDDGTIRHKLENCIPNLNLNLTSNPVICKNCLDSINFIHTFKESCLQYELWLNNFAETCCLNNIDLADLVKNNEKLWLSWVCPDVKPECTYAEDNYTLPIKEEPVENDEKFSSTINEQLQNASYTCNDCNYSTTAKSKLLVHIQSHLVESTLFEIIKEEAQDGGSSDNCNDGDYVPYARQRHICKICKYSTDRRGKLERHLKTHLRTKYKCEKCNFSANNKKSFKNHIKSHVPEEYNFSLVTHGKTDCTKKRFVCRICGYSSNQRGNLNMHARIHTDERLFKCNYCAYSSHQKNNLKIHTMLHTGETPYTCGQCRFRTVYKHALDVHMKIHTGEKPYKCKMCEYSTIYKQSLNVHERTHLKEKPFKCEQCSYSSCQRSNLNVHLKKFHSDLEVADGIP
ncbi:hypothetical protein FQA39_LY10073 [Lamprigera yunnana]|nr:hypothetical protein FQA39_LY10073 [Lamprigera yunnana]